MSAGLHPDSHGGRVQASLMLGTDRFSVEPFASVDYAHLDRQSLGLGQFAETLEPADGVRGKAGARLNAVVAAYLSRVSLYLSGAAVHEFGAHDRLTLATADRLWASSRR